MGSEFLTEGTVSAKAQTCEQSVLGEWPGEQYGWGRGLIKPYNLTFSSAMMGTGLGKIPQMAMQKTLSRQ